MHDPEYLEFDIDRLDGVVVAMARLEDTHTGWVNFSPAVETLPEDRGVFGIFSARGPAVPFGTWTPATAPRRGRPEPAMIGLQHPAGTRARPRLAELGHPVPAGWVVTQDHAKKGLVVVLPPAVPHAQVLEWLLPAAVMLSVVTLTGGWQAAVYPG